MVFFQLLNNSKPSSTTTFLFSENKVHIMANSKVNRGRPVLGQHYYIVRAQFKIRNNLECRTLFFPITLTNMVTRLPPNFFWGYFRTALDKMCFPRKVINGTRNFLVLEVPSLRNSHVMNFVFFFFLFEVIKKNHASSSS